MNTTIELSHFSAAVVFALCASIVFGITQKNLLVDAATGKESPREMIRYGVKCFVTFVAGVLLAGWVMWLLKH